MRRLLLVVAALSGLSAPVLAQDAAPGIAGMDAAALAGFVDQVTTTVGQDSLKMRDAGPKRDCLTMIGLSNSFRLGYGYLGEAGDRAAQLDGDPSIVVRARAVQARVLTFAARVRAEEWLEACTGFAVPAERAADARFAPPGKIAPAEFAEASADLRDAAAVNLAGAVQAATSRDCKRVVAAAEALDLFVPYVDKMIADLTRRPAAQGPRASLSGLQAIRAQLVGVGNSLESEFRPICAGGAAPAAAP